MLSLFLPLSAFSFVFRLRQDSKNTNSSREREGDGEKDKRRVYAVGKPEENLDFGVKVRPFCVALCTCKRRIFVLNLFFLPLSLSLTLSFSSCVSSFLVSFRLLDPLFSYPSRHRRTDPIMEEKGSHSLLLPLTPCVCVCVCVDHL